MSLHDSSNTVVCSDDIMLRPFPVLSGWGHCNASFVFVGDCLKDLNDLKQLIQTNIKLRGINTFTFNIVSFDPTWLYKLWKSYNSILSVIIQSYSTITHEVNTQGIKGHHAWTANRKKI